MKWPTVSGRLRLAGTVFVLAAASSLQLLTGAQAAGSLAVDAQVIKHQTAATSVTSPSFSTTQTNELLLAFISSDGPSKASGQTVTGVTGGSLTWTLRQRTNTQYGDAEIWQAVASAKLSAVTVKATLSSSVSSQLVITSFVNADTTTNGAVAGANAASGAAAASLTTTRAGSWVWGVGADWDSATAHTVGSNQTKVDEYLPTVGDSYWVQRQTSVTPAKGTTVALNTTAPTSDRWDFAAIEVLPAAIDTTAPSAPTNLAATTPTPNQVSLSWTASTDNVGVIGYQVWRGGIQLGTTSLTTYNDATAAAGTTYTYTVRAYDAAGNVSTDSNSVLVLTPIPDTTPPVISNVTVTNVTQTGATISWTTDENADTQLSYGLTSSYGSNSTLQPTLQTTHSVSLTGLSASTTYHYQLRSKDAAGNLATSSDASFVTADPVPDTTPPSVSLSAPTNNATIYGSVTISASATDDRGVAGVQFLLDGSPVGNEVLTSPYNLVWDSTTVSDGSHTLSAVARDAAGNTTTATAVTVTVANTDTVPPTVSLTAPTDGSTVSGTVSLSASASDDRGVAGVQFQIDGANFGSEDTSAPYSIAWNTVLATPGAHTISAVARDAAGNTATATMVNVTVDNTDRTAPTVSITSPTNGSTVSGSSTVTASANDNVGVVGVQFKLDGANLGSEVTTAPYTTSWTTTTASNGTHSLTAIARDGAGNSTTASTISVTVNNSSASNFVINGSQKYQTIDGFGVNANSESWKNGQVTPALDTLINGGTNLWRVIIDNTDWEATNDNSDPNTFNWTYYNSVYSSAKFQDLWSTLAYLNSKGVSANIELNFMGPGPSWLGGSDLTAGQEDEWVEMIASLVYYARNTAHVQFGLLSPTNEEDWNGIEGMRQTATQYALSMNKLAVKLQSLGITDLSLVGPDTADVSVATKSYVPAMMQYPTLMANLNHYSFHDYSGQTANADSIIKSSAYPTKDFWMSEFGTFTQGLQSIGQGAAGLMYWEGYDSAFYHPLLHGAQYVAPNDDGDIPALLAINNSTGVYTPRKQYYQFEQLYKFVPAGSVRIGLTQANSNVMAYAFQDPVSGRLTIVGQNTGTTAVNYAASLTNVASVPSLQVYTTDSANANFSRGTDIPVTDGNFSFTAPANTIFTLTYAAPSDPTPPTTPTNLLATGAVGKAMLNWSASTDNVGVSGYNIYRSTTSGFTPSSANLIGQTTGLSYTDVANPNTYYYQVIAKDAAGNLSSPSNEASAAVLADTTAPSVPTGLATTGVSAGSVSLSWNAATDDVAVAGYQIWRGGVQIGTATTTTYTDNSVTTGNTYSYTVRAYDAAGNVSTDSNSVSATTPATVPLALDKLVTTHQTAAAITISSPALTTSKPNELLLAFVSSDGNRVQSFTTVSGGGLTWTLRQRSNVQPGTAEIWQAVAPATLSNVVVTATRSSGSFVGSISVAAFVGASTTTNGAVASSNGTTAPAVSLITTKPGSWVWAVGNDWDGATARTVGPNQTKVDEFLSVNGNTYWVQRQNAVTPAASTLVTINDTAPTGHKWNYAAIEILQAQ